MLQQNLAKTLHPEHGIDMVLLACRFEKWERRGAGRVGAALQHSEVCGAVFTIHE